jgi:GTP cyclohydrolase I
MIDIQSATSASAFAIDSVGVCNLQYPLRVLDRASGLTQTVAATWRAGVALPAERRGTHMSRFVEVLHERVETACDLEGFLALARELEQRLDARSIQLSASFVWFHTVRAPVTGRESIAAIPMSFAAAIGPGEGDATRREEKIIDLRVPAKALCPCSKAIADRGAHNQRTELRARLHAHSGMELPAFAEVIALLESCASSPVWPLLKREDEKYVTELAYDNPAFVEDLVRSMAERIAELPAVGRFTVEALNQESIHAHDCHARIRHAKPGYVGVRGSE